MPKHKWCLQLGARTWRNLKQSIWQRTRHLQQSVPPVMKSQFSQNNWVIEIGGDTHILSKGSEGGISSYGCNATLLFQRRPLL